MIPFADNTEDQLLWSAFQQGDSKAFEKLYKRYVRVLYSYGYKILPDASVIEDLIQDLFIDLWQSRERLSEAVSPKYYLFRSLRRRIYKAEKRHINRFRELDSEDSDILPPTVPIEYEIIQQEGETQQRKDLEFHLKSLPLRQYEALTLRYYQDLSYAEIADILLINEQSVRNLIQRAVLKLKHLALALSLFLFLFLL